MIDFTYLPDLRLRLTTALKGFASPRMRRAWRNRGIHTHSDWVRCARAAMGDICTPNEILRITPCLYAACSDASTDGVFVGADMRPLNWSLIAIHFMGYLKTKPDRALCRAEFEALHPLKKGLKGRRI